jgi:hypothetical protein
VSLRRSLLVVLLPSLLVGACGEPNGFEGGCQSQINFAVSSGLTPRISWSPSCKLGVLAVAVSPGLSLRPGSRPGGAWMIKTSDQLGPDNLLTPAIRYGEPPQNASTLQPPQPLEAGVLYVVQGWVYDLNGQPIAAGTTPFRP